MRVRWNPFTRTPAAPAPTAEMCPPLTAADLPVRLQRRLERWNRELRGNPEVVLGYFYTGPDLQLVHFKRTWVTSLDLSPDTAALLKDAHNLAVFSGPDLNVAMLLADFHPRQREGSRRAWRNWVEWEHLDDYERTALLRAAIEQTTVSAPTFLGLLDAALAAATQDPATVASDIWGAHLPALAAAVLDLAVGEERDAINLLAGLGTYEQPTCR